jgi:antitoxin MazE
MHATIGKWGNSLGLRIPRGIAQDANMTEGVEVDIRVEDGRLIVEPLQGERLESLVAQITPENRHGEAFSDGPVGREVW